MTSEAEPSKNRPSIPDNDIIDRFGGIRPMASKLGVAVTTVQGWKERGHIPQGRFAQITEAAARHGIDIGTEKSPATKPVAAEPAAAEPEKRSEPQRAKDEMTAAREPEPAPVSEPRPEPVSEPTPAPAPEPQPTSAQPEEIRAAPPAAAPPRPGGGVSWIALIVIVILLGGAILTGPLWQSKLYPGGGTGAGTVDAGRMDEIADGLSAIQDSVQDLRRGLEDARDGLSGRINALEAGGGESGAAFAEQLAAIEQGVKGLAGKMDALDAGLSGIESRIADLEANEGELRESVKANQETVETALGELGRSARALEDGLASVGGVIGDLEGRVMVLETRPLQTGKKIATLALAVGQVEAAMNSGGPFRAALDRLEQIARDDPLVTAEDALAALSLGADAGIPDRLKLYRDFKGLLPEINREISGAEESDWWEIALNNIKSVVTVREIKGKVDDLEPIARAELAMEEGELADAAAAFEGMGSLGADGNAWLERVKARVAAEGEIAELNREINLRLASGDDGGAEATR